MQRELKALQSQTEKEHPSPIRSQYPEDLSSYKQLRRKP